MTRDGIQNWLLQRMSDEDFEAIAPSFRSVELKAAQVLAVPNERLANVYFPQDCILAMTAGFNAAEMISVGVIGYEGMSQHVLHGDEPANLSCFVQSPGAAIAVASDDYAQWICERPSALRDALRYSRYMLSQVSNTALAHGSYLLEQRLARWLLMSFDRLGDRPMPLVHEFISDMLCVRRSGVTTSIHALEGKHAIKSTRGLIELRDRDELVAIAGDSYGAPEREYQKLFGDLPFRAHAE